jgi:hypothetical protein
MTPKSSTEKTGEETTHVLHHETHKNAFPEGMAEAIAAAKLSPWSRPLLKLYGFCAVAFLCSTMNGSPLTYIYQPIRSYSNLN